MPIPFYQLDDRTFEDLVSELLARIPGHTPEWTNPRIGDPGRTLIDLFAWLGDTLLYRVNLLPDRMVAHGITAQDINVAFAAEHVQMAGGFVTGQRTESLVKLDLEFHSIDNSCLPRRWRRAGSNSGN